MLDKIQIRYPYSRYVNESFGNWLHVVATECFKLYSNQHPTHKPFLTDDLPIPYDETRPLNEYVLDKEVSNKFWTSWSNRGNQLVFAVDQTGLTVIELTEENVNSTTKVFNLPLEYPKYKYFFIYFTPAPYENPETGFLVFDTVVFYKEKIRIEKPDLSPVESVLRKSGKSLREKNESSGVADWDFEIVSEGNDWFMNLNAYSDWNVIGKPVDRILIYKPYKDVRKEQEVFLTDIEMGNYWVHHIPRRFLDGNPEIGYVSETGSVEFNSDDIFKYSFEDFICFNNKGDLISKDLLEIDVPEKKIEYTGIDIPTELWFYHFKPGYLSEGEVTFTEKETVISYEDSLFKKTVLYFRQNGETTKFIPYSSATQQVTSESNLRYGYRSGFGYYIEVSDDLIDVPLRTIEFNFPQIYVNQLIKVNESQPEL